METDLVVPNITEDTVDTEDVCEKIFRGEPSSVSAEARSGRCLG